MQGFFILSGFLVCGSFSRIGDPVVFYKRRFLRIYPAYFVAVLLFLVLGLGQALLRGVPVAWGELPRYLAANLTTLNFLQPTIGGVFAGNPMPAINGALWSIKVELMFYAILPLLYAIGERVSLAALAAMLIATGALYWPALNWLGDGSGMAVPLSLKFQLPGQIHFFGIGIALFARSRGQISSFTLLALVVWALALLLVVSGTHEAIQALVLVAVIGGGTVLPQVRDIFARQDISYGVYLAHFPTIQLLLAAGMGAASFGLYLTCVMVIAGAYGIASWRLIERPALAWSRR